MVIQRWQSVFMFVAAVLMVAVNFMSWGVVDGTMWVTPVDFPVMLTLDLLTAVMLLIAIFMFRNMALQKTMVRISALFVVVSAIAGGLAIYNGDYDGVLDFKGGVWALVGALVLIVMAIVRIASDERLLKSSDRIR